MKLIEIVKWEDSHVAVALVYADQASDLSTTLKDGLTLSKGSLAYLANGNVYVLGTTWSRIGG